MSTFPAQVLFTKYTSYAEELVKKYHPTEDNQQIRSEGKISFFTGRAETCAVTSIHEFHEVLENLQQNQAIGLGLHSINVGAMKEISTKLEIERNPDIDAISRSLKDFHFYSIPGWVLLDIDTTWISEETCPRVWQYIEGDFSNLPWLVIDMLELSGFYLRPSSSSRVYIPGITLPKPKGFHLYLPINNQLEIPSKTRWCFEMLNNNRLGFVVLNNPTKGKCSELERGLIDISVASPERLIYEALPKVFPPVRIAPTELRVNNIGSVLKVLDPFS